MNWRLFSPKIDDAWTPAAGRAPRWFSSNAYPDLDTLPEIPELSSNPVGTFTVPSASGVVPYSWTLSPDAPLKPTSTLQALLFILNEERALLNLSMKSLYHTRAFGFDLAEPDFAWYASNVDSDLPIYVQTTSGYVEVPSATSTNSLIYTNKWSYQKSGQEVLLTGFGLLESSTISVSGWYFISSGSVFDSSSLVHFKHPTTQTWIPVHPTNLRFDGFTGFTGVGSTAVRTYSKEAAARLTTLNLLTNGKPYTADLVPLWTSIDEKALWFGLRRKLHETTASLAERLLGCSWFGKDQSIESTRNAISSSLGLSRISVSERLPGFTTAVSGFSHVSIRNIEKIQTATERLTVDENDVIRSRYYAPQRGTVFCGDNIYEATSASGIVTVRDYTHRYSDYLYADWTMYMYTSASSAITFTANMPLEGPDYVTLSTRDVEVENSPEEDLIECFDKTWPGYKWQSSPMAQLTDDASTAAFD